MIVTMKKRAKSTSTAMTRKIGTKTRSQIRSDTKMTTNTETATDTKIGTQTRTMIDGGVQRQRLGRMIVLALPMTGCIIMAARVEVGV